MQRGHRIADALVRPLSRRRVLTRGAALTLGAPVVAGLLAACGEDEAAPVATTAANVATSVSGAAGATTAPAATSAPATSVSAPTAAAAAGQPTPAAAKATPSGQPGGTLKHAILREPTTFDPHIDNGHTSTTIQGNTYDTLVTYNDEGDFAPLLARSWDVTPDGKTYTLKLQTGVTFHSGDPFTADDVVATIKRIIEPETKATLRPEMSNVDTYTASDASTVKITMKQPYAPFIAVLASQRHAGIVSKKWTEAGNDYATKINGTGAFKLESFEAKVRYILAKNPSYWEPGLPYLDKMEQVVINNETARVNAFKSGQVNFMAYTPWQNMKEFEAGSTFKLFKGFDVFNLVRFNPQRPPFDNPLVRQAFNYIVDRQAMIDLAFGGQGRPISVGLIAQDSIWYNKELDGHWKHDPAKAKQLLAQAGINDPSQVAINFRSSTSAVHFDTAQVITQQLEQFGFKVTLEPQDSATLLQRRQTADYQIMMDGLSVPWLDPDFYTSFFSTEGPAHAKPVGYSNAKFDQLLEQGRTTVEFAKRKEIYRRAEEALLADPPWIFLFWRPQAETAARNVEGYVRINGMGGYSEGYMKRVWIKK